MLPEGFPKWRTVYYCFQQWSEIPEEKNTSLLSQALKNRVGAAREKQDREASTRYYIIDAQSVRNTDTARSKGYDAGKKISEIKRHIAVDTQGLRHAITATNADVADRNGAIAAFSRQAENLSAVQGVLADGGYSRKTFAQEVESIRGYC